MRAFRAMVLAGTALAATNMPAAAAWNSYVDSGLGYSFRMPGELRVETGVYRAAVGGASDALIYRSEENNIAYRVSVIDFTARAAEGSTLMEEAAFIIQDGKEVIMNDFGRVDTGQNAVYGRRMTINMPEDGGRKSVATYFNKGHLFVMEATVLPANGDYAAPDPGLFIDSLVFVSDRFEPGATELPEPE